MVVLLKVRQELNATQLKTDGSGPTDVAVLMVPAPACFRG